MDKIKASFEESDLFKLNANFPELLATRIIEQCGDLTPEQAEAIKGGFMELGFFLTSAASASYRLTHAVDLIRNQGNMGPDVRYLVMEASSELTNAVMYNEPIARVNGLLVELGENLDDWSSEVPVDLDDDGVAVQYLRNYKNIVNGKLINFRYKDLDNNTVITDIPCIYDHELHAYMPLTNNPAWKYVKDETGSTEEISDDTKPTAHADVKEDQESSNDGSPASE